MFCIIGETFEGHFKGGKRNGEGTKMWTDQRRYVGNWQHDRFHGQGIFTFPAPHSRYAGKWSKGKRNGNGVMQYEDMSSYTGQWKNDLRQGEGRYLNFDGTMYTGEWQKGRYHGKGELHLAGTETYVGEWREGRKHGFGVQVWVHGAQYEGEWVHGTQVRRIIVIINLKTLISLDIRLDKVLWWRTMAPRMKGAGSTGYATGMGTLLPQVG